MVSKKLMALESSVWPIACWMHGTDVYQNKQKPYFFWPCLVMINSSLAHYLFHCSSPSNVFCTYMQLTPASSMVPCVGQHLHINSLESPFLSRRTFVLQVHQCRCQVLAKHTKHFFLFSFPSSRPCQITFVPIGSQLGFSITCGIPLVIVL